MNKQRAVAGLAGLAVIALVAAVVAIGHNVGARVPQPNRLGYPIYAQTVPEGCHTVAPGAYSTICDGDTADVPVNNPSHGPAIDCHPVAPGSFSQICVRRGTADSPAQPAPTPSGIECRPVAPGAFTQICTRP
jgi:hypothetical protein